jgi:hypothetical protein
MRLACVAGVLWLLAGCASGAGRLPECKGKSVPINAVVLERVAAESAKHVG